MPKRDNTTKLFKNNDPYNALHFPILIIIMQALLKNLGNCDPRDRIILGFFRFPFLNLFFRVPTT